MKGTISCSSSGSGRSSAIRRQNVRSGLCMVPPCITPPVWTGFIGTASIPQARIHTNTAAAAIVLPASVSVPVIKTPFPGGIISLPCRYIKNAVGREYPAGRGRKSLIVISDQLSQFGLVEQLASAVRRRCNALPVQASKKSARGVIALPQDFLAVAFDLKPCRRKCFQDFFRTRQAYGGGLGGKQARSGGMEFPECPLDHQGRNKASAGFEHAAEPFDGFRYR